MKSITLFINTLGSGGAEHQLVQLADGLTERGYLVSIITFGDELDHYQYDSSIMRFRIAPQKGKFLKLLMIWKFFFKVKTDWVIAFGQRESCYCLEGLLLRSRDKVRVIASDRNTTYGKPSLAERLLMNVLYYRADYIVPNSYAQRSYILAQRPQLEKKTKTITNYTNLSKFANTILPSNKFLHIGVFGRYSPQKNCIRFVEAIKILHEKSNCSFIVDWYGNTHFKDSQLNDYYLKMREKVEEYGLREILFLNDHVRDVPNLMPSFDAICLPSIFEGFSNSISEAICSGKPCLVSNVSDNSIMVRDGVNGFLFDPFDVESIVNAFLSYFKLSADERVAMGAASRRRAEELFDRERFINSYVELIES